VKAAPNNTNIPSSPTQAVDISQFQRNRCYRLRVKAHVVGGGGVGGVETVPDTEAESDWSELSPIYSRTAFGTLPVEPSIPLSQRCNCSCTACCVRYNYFIPYCLRSFYRHRVKTWPPIDRNLRWIFRLFALFPFLCGIVLILVGFLVESLPSSIAEILWIIGVVIAGLGFLFGLILEVIPWLVVYGSVYYRQCRRYRCVCYIDENCLFRPFQAHWGIATPQRRKSRSVQPPMTIGEPMGVPGLTDGD